MFHVGGVCPSSKAIEFGIETSSEMAAVLPLVASTVHVGVDTFKDGAVHVVIFCHFNIEQTV